MKKILIAIDDGPFSEKIALEGLKIGQQLNAEIALISVVDTRGLISEGSITAGEFEDIMENDFKKNQQLLVGKLFKDVKVVTFVESGNPFEAILRVADEWEADLIVLGTHGRTGLTHLLLGSVAEKVIRHSKKPLLVIPSK
jgi:nucleotide-binding universal stress UspA family protein